MKSQSLPLILLRSIRLIFGGSQRRGIGDQYAGYFKIAIPQKRSKRCANGEYAAEPTKSRRFNLSVFKIIAPLIRGVPCNELFGNKAMKY